MVRFLERVDKGRIGVAFPDEQRERGFLFLARGEEKRSDEKRQGDKLAKSGPPQKPTPTRTLR